MNDKIIELLLSKRAVTVYELAAILILIWILIRQSKKKREMDERRQISNIKMRNVQLEKMLKNPYIKSTQSGRPNPYDVQYKEKSDKPLAARCQVEIEVHSEISVQKYLFDLNQELSIGRDETNVLPLNDKLAARKSCVIFLKERAVCLKNLSSNHPVLLRRGKNWMRVEDQIVKLQSRDILTLGKTALHISIYEN